MSHITKEEYLSAFVDGEAGSFEQHRICDQLATDEVMRDKFSSFSLIGEAMRNHTQTKAIIASPSFLSGIQDGIAGDEPLAFTPDDSTIISLGAAKAKKKRALPKQAFGYAVAASVAAVAAISFQNYTSTPEMGQQIAKAAIEAEVPVNKIQVSTIIPNLKPLKANPVKAAVQNDYLIATSFKAPDAKTRGLMNKYVAHHLQYASSSTLMPRVRAVSYSTDF